MKNEEYKKLSYPAWKNTHNCVPKLQAYPPIFSLTPKASGSTWLQSCEVRCGIIYT